ncbi:unnamed protein product [marine sediment metagenome]|uniref:Uncharacterized protein n=1 Tax=marine sediment metagenome TaxID=412755 RepID=X1AGN6_9ZZZZ
MKTLYRVLSDEERHRVHEESLNILENTGVRVETPLGRKILRDVGGDVDDGQYMPISSNESDRRVAAFQSS